MELEIEQFLATCSEQEGVVKSHGDSGTSDTLAHSVALIRQKALFKKRDTLPVAEPNKTSLLSSLATRNSPWDERTN